MDVERRFELITRNTEEVITASDLKHFLETGIKLNHYIGFEISGKMHIGTGLMSMLKIKDFIDANVSVSIFLADWHTWINDKLSGELEVIKKVAVGYFKEGFKACAKCVGAKPEKIEFILGSELYSQNDRYWATVIDVSRHLTLSRVKRALPIMGRKESDSLDFAKFVYPPMQVADIFFLGVTLAHAGLDQRKAHVIAREVALKMKVSPLLDEKGEKIKPIAVHHPLLLGLGKPPQWPVPEEKLKEFLSALKMSKSLPKTCIFIHDEPVEIKEKLNKAFCPAREIRFNPILNWVKHLVFRDEKSELLVERPAKFGGNITYYSYADLEKDFASGKLHPLDLKNAVAEKLIEMLKPAREHFKKPALQKMLAELEKMTTAKQC